MHVLNDKIRNNSVKTCARHLVLYQSEGRMSPRTWYTKLNLVFPNVRSLSLRRDIHNYCTQSQLNGVVLFDLY